MPDLAPEIVYTGAATPPSWGERLIRAHTPEAHYQDIMNKYFWVTDRLEGPSLELALRLRPTVELYAKAAGWSQTMMELYLAGSAVAITTILAGKGLKSAAVVFGEMARRHGGKATEGTVALLTAGTGSVVASRQDSASDATPAPSSIGDDSGDAGSDGAKPLATAMDRTHEIMAEPNDEERVDGRSRKKKRKPAKARRNDDRRRGGIPVFNDDETGMPAAEIASAAVPGENGGKPPGSDTRAPSPKNIPMDRWGKAYDEAIGTDPSAADQKARTLSLLKSMMMDRNEGGFSDTLAQAMVEPNGEIRKRMAEAAVQEAAQAFDVDEEATLAAQLLIEHLTSQASTPVSASKV